jgi:hypothetical protein
VDEGVGEDEGRMSNVEAIGSIEDEVAMFVNVLCSCFEEVGRRDEDCAYWRFKITVFPSVQLGF